jgi:hypothetical protein
MLRANRQFLPGHVWHITHLRSRPVTIVPIVQPLRSVQIVEEGGRQNSVPLDLSINGRPVLPIDSCLGRLGESFIHFFFEGEQLLDARALLHALEMRRDVGEP